MDLYPYQVEGAAFLAARGRALLADSMGLGKSAQAIRACDSVGAERVLVVCPASLVENWRREFAKFSERNLKPTVVSYNRATTAPELAIDWDVLIQGAAAPGWRLEVVDLVAGAAVEQVVDRVGAEERVIHPWVLRHVL